MSNWLILGVGIAVGLILALLVVRLFIARAAITAAIDEALAAYASGAATKDLTCEQLLAVRKAQEES